MKLIWKISGVLIFVLYGILRADGQCSQTAQGVRRFGEKCNYRCHCVADEQCDFSTGACTSGCDFSWTGPGCQYKNIALMEQSRQSDNLRYNPEYSVRANDKSITTCSYTGEEHTSRPRAPWWALWFREQKTFSEFVFTTGDNFLAYLPGFNISVQQNVTAQQHSDKAYLTGTTCYQHDLSIPPNNTVHVMCNYDLVGNQLRIQLANTSTQLVLCDVRVYSECKDRKWGQTCQHECGLCQNLEECETSNGHCSNGCELGYKNTTLCDQECDLGTYGLNCLGKCSNCKNKICHRETGVCSQGCNPGYIAEKCEDKETPGTSFPVAAVAGGLSAALVAVVIGLIVIVVFRRRTLVKIKGNASSNREKSLTQDTDMDSKDLGGQRPSSNERVQSPASGHEVLIADLQEYVKTNLEDNEYLINQFKELPRGMQFPSTAADERENRIKNTYINIFPYDHSRVVLKSAQGGSETDYINASYIKGHNGEISYIAAQGPLPRTLEDFWMMIWEQDIRTIVMVTGRHVNEDMMRCCEKYWPDPYWGSEQYGQISVYIESEDEFAEFTIRHMKLNHECESDNCKAVTHFHYKVWPVESVPRCPSSLLHFWYQVRKHDARKTIPWLVHCRSGVGRTGTFIAVDILYDQGKDKGVVDIYRCIRELREQRIHMVQNIDQYKFLHTIMLEAFVLPWKPVSIDTFPDTYGELQSVARATGSSKTRLLLQFESLNEETECGIGHGAHTNLNYTASKATENRNKNRYEYILAPNEFRPFLYTKEQGWTEYINAIYLPSYRHKHGYIITQTPLKNTEVDHCRLIVQKEIKIIVAFEDNGDEKVGKYLPEKGSLDIGPFTITCMSEEDQPLFIKRQYELQFNARNHTFTQIVFKKWLKSKLTPSYPSEMLCFVQELEHLQRQTVNTPVLVQCWNGATRSGLIVVLMNILERVRFDGEVSVTNVIRQLKSHRQQIIPNFEQFKFCHDVLLAHVSCDSIYANM